MWILFKRRLWIWVFFYFDSIRYEASEEIQQGFVGYWREPVSGIYICNDLFFLPIFCFTEFFCFRFFFSFIDSSFSSGSSLFVVGHTPFFCSAFCFSFIFCVLPWHFMYWQLSKKQGTLLSIIIIYNFSNSSHNNEKKKINISFMEKKYNLNNMFLKISLI